ncbi:MAG TPA: hypothetical protein V6C72_12500 [Chroococcales cyanobacterium]
MLEVIVAVTAVLMLGTANIRMNLATYSLHTMLLSALTASIGYVRHENHFYIVAAAVFLIKGIGAPTFLRWILGKIQVQNDPGLYLPASISMHTGIVLMGVSYLLAKDLPGAYVTADATYGAASALSLLFSGILMMVTRRTAMSQIIGFLLIENGIFLFTLSKTAGMPMAVEMGILLDVLVGIMVAGLLLFRIQKSFEHIDVTKMTELRD